MGKLILLLGGARSGKSSAAQKIAAQQEGPVLYIA
ncbi:MAG: bifunctional adenosylcobinamide kinase/adenosylcobinamide-phosphate guanylyltransferase, partial [Chloroflexi bacterium]